VYNLPLMKTTPLLISTLVFSLIFMTFPVHADKPSLVADTIIVNAVVHTMDPAQPTAEAVAIYANRIVAVGSSKDIKKLAGPNTRTIDAKKRLLLPGFNDAHTHFLSGGFQLSSVDLRDANSPQEFAARINAFAAKLPRGRWITGGDWDHERWPDAKLPAKELIDAITPDTPVFVSRLDGHMALANSLALKLAGVTRQTLDPPGGVIVRDKSGEPTGVLKDAAQSFVWKVIPPASFAERLAAAKAATEYAARLGVTSIQDVSAGTDVGVYQTLLTVAS
jgi:predicted amidohydrolase YtcJ